jgi:hypothetical protein
MITSSSSSTSSVVRYSLGVTNWKAQQTEPQHSGTQST